MFAIQVDGKSKEAGEKPFDLRVFLRKGSGMVCSSVVLTRRRALKASARSLRHFRAANGSEGWLASVAVPLS